MGTLMVNADRLCRSFLAPARISLPGTHSASRFMRARYVVRAVAVIGSCMDDVSPPVAKKAERESELRSSPPATLSSSRPKEREPPSGETNV